MIPQNYLSVPISIYDGIVEIRGKKDLHPLHKLILLRSVHEHDLDTVVTSFNLKAQIVHEAIIDLLYRGLILLDLESSRIYTNSDVETAIDRGRLDEFLGMQYPETVNIQWIQDMSTGQVFMLDEAIQYLRRPSNLNDQNQQRLSKSDYVKITELNAKTLIKTAKMTLRSQYFDADLFDRISRINDLRLRDTSILYIPLTQRKLKGNKTISFPEAPSISSSVVEKWTKAITELDPYSISDLSPADENYLLNYHWTLIIEKIWRVINGVSNVFSRASNQSKKRTLRLTINKINQEILEKLYPLYPILVNLAFFRADATIRFSQGTQILDNLKNMIEKAQSLVILGSSFISERGMQEVFDLVETLRDKRVRVLLIWGNLGRSIEGVRDQFPILNEDWISLVRSTTPFHSKFLVIDKEVAWITSCNLMSYWYEGSSPKEMICRIENTNTIDDIVEYTRTKVPPTSVEITWIDQLLKHVESVSEFDTNVFEQFRDNLIEFRDNCFDLLRNIGDNTKLTLLRNSFDELKTFKKEFQKLKIGVLIQNLEHRKILRSVLSNASKYVRIGTDNIYTKAIGPVITRDLNDALDEEISVEILWWKEDPNNASEDELENYKSTIEDLNESTKNRISISQAPSHSHAKYMTMDHDFIVVTSFNLLAFSGNGLDDADITDELGIAISGRSVTKDIF